MRIALITAAWMRYELFEFFCWFWSETVKQQTCCMELTLYCAVSDAYSKEIARKYGFATIDIENDPLHVKWNEITLKAMAEKPDYCLFVGSDDIINGTMLQHYVKLMEKGTDYIAPLDWYFFDTISKQGLYWAGYREPYRKGEPCGAGRALSRQCLDRLEWKPWASGNDKMLDTAFKVKKHGGTFTRQFFYISRTEGCMALDIKTETNMTPFRQWDNTNIIEKPQELFIQHFDMPCVTKIYNLKNESTGKQPEGMVPDLQG